MQIRVRSTQKLPSRSVRLRVKPRTSAIGDGDTDRGRDEVLHRQAGHLRDVAERALAGVGLPVGVGDEAGGGVEGLVGMHLRHRVRVAEEVGLLYPQERVEEEHRDRENASTLRR